MHADACGLSRIPSSGLLPQPNPWTASWVEFFGEQRLRRQGGRPWPWRPHARGVDGAHRRVSSPAGDIIEEPARPSLVHGDIWSANVLAQDGRITGVLDPAVYYGHREIELAYIFLFHSFGGAFRHRYLELWPLTPGYFQSGFSSYNIPCSATFVTSAGTMWRAPRRRSRLGF
ncbi:MAG: fructosamine kinase family protein [Caldilineaceae bacterium]